MVTVPLGMHAYKRSFAGEPEIKLVNRYVEKNPSNLVERSTLLARGGTTALAQFSGGNIRGCYTKEGFMNSDLFVISGANFYRYTEDGTKTQITGTISGTGTPYVTWMKGIGYEYLFIADGFHLQYYGGGVYASGTLTLTPSTPPDIGSQVIQIGGVYYSWNADVEHGTPDGTSARPWLCLVGANDAASLVNMMNMINFAGNPGTDFSSALAGANADYYASSTTATTLVITARSPYVDGTGISTTVFSGSQLAWGATTLTGGNVHALSFVETPDANPIKALASVSGYVLASVSNSQKFYWINPGEVTIDPLNFAEKESNPDNILDMLTVGDQVLICGNGSTENWYASGDSTAPFVPMQGRVYRRGVWEGTPVNVDEQVILVGNDGIVYMIGGSGVQRISDNAIEERIRTQIRREKGFPA